MVSQSASASLIGNRSFSFLAVVALHVAAIYAFYSGLMTRVALHLPPIFELIPTQTVDRASRRPRSVADPVIKQPMLFVPIPEFSAGDSSSEGVEDTTSKSEKPQSTEVLVAHSYSAASYDPSRPFKVGEDYYPPGAVRLGQEGRCVVQVTVAPDGRITAATLAHSTRFPLLDQACLTAVNGQRMRPAIQDGKAVESRVLVPIMWKLRISDR